MTENIERENLTVINAQLQVIDAPISALIEEHPNQDLLIDQTQMSYSLLSPMVSTQSIGSGTSINVRIFCKITRTKTCTSTTRKRIEVAV